MMMMKERATSKINRHTTHEVDRATEAVHAAKSELLDAVALRMQNPAPEPRPGALQTMARLMQYKVEDLRDFLAEKGIKPCGTKVMVAETIAREFCISDFEERMHPPTKRPRITNCEPKEKDGGACDTASTSAGSSGSPEDGSCSSSSSLHSAKDAKVCEQDGDGPVDMISLLRPVVHPLVLRALKAIEKPSL